MESDIKGLKEALRTLQEKQKKKSHISWFISSTMFH